MRTYLFFYFLCFCFIQSWGQSYIYRMDTAIDIGTHSEPFIYTNTQNVQEYTDDYICQTYLYNYDSNDVFYKLTLSKSMDIRVRITSEYMNDATISHLMDSSGNELMEELSLTSFYVGLQPGVYYIVAEVNPNNSNPLPDYVDLTITVTGKERMPGEDFFYLYDMGTFDTNFKTSYTIEDFEKYKMDYKDRYPLKDGLGHDFVCQFVINQPMEITLDNCGTKFDMRENIHHAVLLSASKDTIKPNLVNHDCTEQKKYELEAGTYYIYAWSHIECSHCSTKYIINLEGREFATGSHFMSPINIGNQAESFTYTDTKNTEQFSNNRFPNKGGNEVFYKLTLINPMELTIDNFGSGKIDTYLQIFSADQKLLYANDNAEITDTFIGTQIAKIHIPILFPGTYYIVSDVANNGNVTTNVTGRFISLYGDKNETAIDAGEHGIGFSFSDTRDTSSGYTNVFNGKATNDVYYKFTLLKPMNVAIRHCGSDLEDTYMSLLDINGALLYSNDNYIGEDQCDKTSHAFIQIEQLPAGTYYIVSEGTHNNGLITTTIEVNSLCDILQTTEGQPHIVTLTPIIATDNMEVLRTHEAQCNIQYFDHFGNPELNIRHGFAPNGGDLVTLQEYDGFNRESNLWLPVVKETSGGGYLSPAEIQKTARSATYYGNDRSPFSRPVYDGSPLNRIVEKYGPGDDWKYHPVKTDLLTNLGSTDVLSQYDGYLVVYKYQVAGDSLINKGAYPTGTLDVTRTTNEDNQVSYEFKDRVGRLLLSRRISGGQMFDTNYVYDDSGNMRMVLPPLASDSLSSIGSWHESVPSLRRYGYFYKYDGYNRCIYKRLPGCEPVYSVYDRADRLIFTQDGEQRKRSEWSFSIPDPFGQTVLSGTCHNSFDYTSNPLDSILVKAVWEQSTNVTKGYAVTGITLITPVILAVNYYDHYDFIGLNGIPQGAGTAYEEVSGYGKRYTGGSKNLLTGTLTACLSSAGSVSGYLYSVMYYDDRERLVQQKSANSKGGYDNVFTAYNFPGQPVSVKKVHSVPGKETQCELYSNTYDHAGRLLRTTYQLNENNPVTLADCIYDEVGRLKTDKHNGNANLKTDYAYNLRSWTKSITNPLFNQSLYYIDGTGTPCYSGNISSMTWKVGSAEKGYTFTYDGLSRLTDAVYGEGHDISVNPNRFTEQVTGYDKMGNILGLKRYGQVSSSAYNLIDDLSLAYEGNQLRSVTDAASQGSYNNGFEFKDRAQLPTEYEYDSNGNLIKDLNKNISSIQYNFLNLPRLITFGDGNTISYEYDSKGTKLRTVHTLGGTVTTTDYCGNAIYENGVLKKLLVETGYVTFPDQKLHYYLEDHQGNVRVVADENGRVEEQNDYYPFGGLMSSSTASVQPYKYNGKELDRKGGLDWYDYGARHYDAAIGRWHMVDPMADKYYDVGPYVYCLNNPFLLVDPNGMWPTWGGIKSGFRRAAGASLSFVNGAARAIVDNISLGTLSLRDSGIYSSASAYNAGQDVGDILSIVIGGAEVVKGLGEISGGVLASPETAGASLAISAQGALDITHGSLTATSGALKLFSRKGRVDESSSDSGGYSKSSGKNEKHSNLKARKAAEEKMNAAKEKLEIMGKDPKFTNKELNEVKKEIKHWKRKMDEAGETHHRK